MLGVEVAWSEFLEENLPRRFERECQRVLGQAGDERLDDPAESEGDVAGERNRLALDVDAAVAFEQPPVRIQTPEIAAVASHRQLTFVGHAGVLDLRHARAADVAARTVRS